MAINSTSAEYKLDLSNGLSTSIYTTPNELKTWTLSTIQTEKYPTSMTLSGNILRLTLADTTVLTTDLTPLIGTSSVYPTSMNFNNTSRLLTIALSNSTNLTSTINDSVLQSATLTNKVLTLTNTNATSTTVDLSPISDNSVITGTYNQSTEVLTLVKKDSSTVNVNLIGTRNKHYSIGSVLDTTGTFDATYSTVSYTIPNNQGNIAMLLNIADTTAPVSLYLPRLEDVYIGWECNILVYDTSGVNTNKPIGISDGTYGLYNDMLDPLPTTSPYSNLTNSINLEKGHYYRIKKVSNKFYLIQYS